MLRWCSSPCGWGGIYLCTAVDCQLTYTSPLLLSAAYNRFDLYPCSMGSMLRNPYLYMKSECWPSTWAPRKSSGFDSPLTLANMIRYTSISSRSTMRYVPHIFCHILILHNLSTYLFRLLPLLGWAFLDEREIHALYSHIHLKPIYAIRRTCCHIAKYVVIFYHNLWGMMIHIILGYFFS